MEKSTGKGTLCTSWLCLVLKKYLFHIRHCFICRPSDAAVSEDAGGRTEDFYDFGIGSQMLFITLGYRSFLYTLGFRSLPHSVIDIINIRLQISLTLGQISTTLCKISSTLGNRSHPHSAIDLIHTRQQISNTLGYRSHPHSATLLICAWSLSNIKIHLGQA